MSRAKSVNEDAIVFDAVILSGGRSSRLGGVPKASLRTTAGTRQTLLARTCDAASSARRLVVVGPVDADAPRRAEIIREDPPFGGPAAAVSAAVVHLDPDPAPWLLVLACDMPGIAQAVPGLLAGAAATGASVLASDGGRDQPLAALYRFPELKAQADPAVMKNLSMRRLLARVQWSAVEVPPGSTHDVDTWTDAHNLGVEETDAGC